MGEERGSGRQLAACRKEMSVTTRHSAVDVRTVTGCVSSGNLGFTLPHEHLFNDISVRGLTPSPAFPELFHAEVSPHIAWVLNEYPLACLDNCRLDNYQDALREVSDYAKYGGRTIVDVTPEGQGRDLERLAKLSRETGVNIVAGGGWYLEPYQPGWAADWSEEDIAEYFLSSSYRNVAVDDQSPMPGVIGEIGVSPQMTDRELSSLRAACIVQRERRVPLYVHLPGFVRYANIVLDIVLKEQGVPAESVVLCHVDPSGDSPEYQRSLAERGVWLEFDMIGMPYRFSLPGEGRAPSVGQTLEAIMKLIKSGFGHSLLFSHDMFLKSMLRKNGGNGLLFVPEVFHKLLALEDLGGFESELINTENVSRVFEMSV